ncbi:MAG: hypothetical protein BWK72_08110 [Rhodoferax ferrireducens]|uniref:Glycosyltransferase 2-like domain-containing protein n=2 Tax=Pseudomonadota TaxID=1224 RepID=A0A1Y1R0Q5_9GAMM|nr:MAG: hypothetical protein BWK72_08110 [Rhodoferax ferrireducens]OQX17444.1 MAG: hypothetical protein BWK73_01900 [Thiothrix lacustris]
MSTLPTISIVTCSYQQAKFLGFTLRSVIDQQYPSLEYIVVDGCSTDGSVAVIEHFSKFLAHHVSERDKGQSEALNKGLRLSKGEIVGWLCSDDLLLPGSLEAVAKYFAANPTVDAVYGDAILIDATGVVQRAKREMGFSPFTLLYDHNYIPQPSMFWRRRLMQDVGLLDETLHLSMDADYWLRFAKNGLVRHMPVLLSCMRMHKSQKVFIDRAGVFRESESLRDQYANVSTSSVSGRFLRGYARVYRVIRRFLESGYDYSVPKDVQVWLQSLHCSEGYIEPSDCVSSK